VRVGDAWVIHGEKWFTSAGRVADILFEKDPDLRKIADGYAECIARRT